VDDLKTVVAGPAIDDAVIDAWRNAVPDVLVGVWNDADYPAHDECFGFTPLLALGGPEHPDRLSVVKLREHVLMITQLTGPLY
jgi:hypothetical protein